jgi:predicted O-methyltransferase YrrM
MDFEAIRKLPVLMSDEERILLYALILNLRPKAVLEIGVWQGGSSKIIAMALDAAGGGRLISVDPEPRLEVEWQSIAHCATLLKGPSPQVLPEAMKLAGGRFDFVLIDGGHMLDEVRADIRGVLDVITRGAYLLFHDVYCPPVKQALDEAVASSHMLTDCGYIATHHEIKEGTGPWGGFRLLRAGAPALKGWKSPAYRLLHRLKNSL